MYYILSSQEPIIEHSASVSVRNRRIKRLKKLNS
ncbi:MAG: hypothetical protein ACI8RD_012415, partial [Bacillariaceae sp.]